MDRLRGRNSPIRKMKTNLNLCLPCLQKFNSSTSSSASRPSKPLTPMTLLERFREAVFRFIMLSALSKVQTNPTATTSTCSLSSSSISQASRSCYYYNPVDPHHSEAVADCIEFIKRKAFTDQDDDDQSREAIASVNSSIEIGRAHV